LVEQVESGFGSVFIDRPGLCEQPQMGINLFRRCLGDSPVVHPILTNSTMVFGEVGGNRRSRSNDLIGDAFQRRRNPNHDRFGNSGRFAPPLGAFSSRGFVMKIGRVQPLEENDLGGLRRTWETQSLTRSP